jgi:ABC-type glutathione transport system ATPase component
MTPAALLSVQHLQTRVRGETGEMTVVDGASFEIGRQEVLALIGESG